MPTAALSLVVVYGEFADRARLGIGQSMDGLGVVLLALPVLFTVLWASYVLSRAWPAVVMLLSSARDGVRLRPGAAFAATGGRQPWPVSTLTAGSMFAFLAAELAFPGVLYANPLIAHVLEAAGPALVTAPAAWWGCVRVLSQPGWVTRPAGSAVRWVAVSGAVVLVGVAVGLSAATNARYGTGDALPGHPLAVFISVLVCVAATVTVGAALAAVTVLTRLPPRSAGSTPTPPLPAPAADGATPRPGDRAPRYGRLAAVIGCVVAAYALWVAGNPFLAPIVLFVLAPWIGKGLLQHARTNVGTGLTDPVAPASPLAPIDPDTLTARPAAVTVASILLVIFAAALTLVSAGTFMGYLMLAGSKIGSDVPASTFKIAAITSFLLAVVAILAVTGILRGSPRARVAAILIACLTLVVLLADVVRGHNLNLIGGLAIAAGSAAIVYLLAFTDRSKKFFTQLPPAAPPN